MHATTAPTREVIITTPPFPGPLGLIVPSNLAGKTHVHRRLTHSPPLDKAFLSCLRLSIYMAVVSIAISMSFHVKHQPTEFELRMAKPLGIVFWSLSVMMLFLGLGNYISVFLLFFPF